MTTALDQRSPMSQHTHYTDSDEAVNNGDPLQALMQATLLREYGPVIGGDELRRALGLASMDALRQAVARQQLPVPVFNIQHRRGLFALTTDLAQWLAALRLSHGRSDDRTV
jgi:hypothetical protein